MDTQLPTNFDLVIVGTGVIESIISAAASRVGKNVLHLDRNEYYGGQWASFNLNSLDTFSPLTKTEETESTDLLPIGNTIFNIKDYETKWHIADGITENEESCDKKPDFTESLTCVAGDGGSKELVGGQDENKEESEINIENLLDNVTLKETRQESYTKQSLLKESRKFNIDLVPKLHYARGDYVGLLISSNIARYMEYRSVSRVLTWLNDQLEVVPCSRSDVFANNKVSVIEKRMLMKLLTSLDENADCEDTGKVTFRQYLAGKKLSPNLIHFVLYAMSMSTDETSVTEGIKNTKRFLNSLGRFGKTPFLFSMYGSGETTQAFCRLSAVFGGVYALNQSSMRGIKLEENKVKLLVNNGQDINAEHFVLSAEDAPKDFVNSIVVKDYISRAVFITDRSIMESEQEHLTLLMYPPECGRNITTLIEMGSLTGTCPKNLYLVHLTAKQVSTPQEDFRHIINNLFQSEELETENSKPVVLWSCFFSLPEFSNIDINKDLPDNLYLCDGPDLDLDYDSSIEKAKNIFKKIYPDLEFLPRAPDPEEIIIGDECAPSDPVMSEDMVASNAKSDGDKNE